MMQCNWDITHNGYLELFESEWYSKIMYVNNVNVLDVYAAIEI